MRTLHDLDEILLLIDDAWAAADAAGRPVLVGLVGAPGAGKSTIAAELVESIRADGLTASLLPMDGYHLPQAELVRLGRRERMGAPDTFDVDALVALLERVRAGGDAGGTAGTGGGGSGSGSGGTGSGTGSGTGVLAPGFDRAVEEAVPDAIALDTSPGAVVVVEGNYLLHDADGWERVAPLLDATLFLMLEPGIRHERLIARHIRFGKSPEAAAAWALGPDEANARLIEAGIGRADAVLRHEDHRRRPGAPLTILHLSDSHLLGDPGARYNGVIDTAAALRAVLDAHADVAGIDVVALSGDLSQDGSPESYRVLVEIVEPWAEERRATVVYALGNHDDRTAFTGVTGIWVPLDQSEEQLAARFAAPYNRSRVVAGVRFLSIDTLVPGFSHGTLADSTLDWLRTQLATPAPFGTVVVLHHPPVPAETEFHAGIGLTNPEDFRAAIAGTDVRLILAGHWHHQLIDTSLGVPVVVTPGLANRTDALKPVGRERSVVASAGTLIRLDRRTGGVRVTATEVPVADRGRVLFDVGPEEWRRWT